MKHLALKLTAVLTLAFSAQAFAFVTCIPADAEVAQNIQCIHLARMKVKNTIVQKPLFVQTDDGKLVRTTVNYHTDGNRSHFLIESKARGFSVTIDYRNANWDTMRGMQPDARLSVFGSRSHYDGKLYCSSKLAMEYIRERCPDLSDSEESMLESVLEE